LDRLIVPDSRQRTPPLQATYAVGPSRPGDAARPRRTRPPDRTVARPAAGSAPLRRRWPMPWPCGRTLIRAIGPPYSNVPQARGPLAHASGSGRHGPSPVRPGVRPLPSKRVPAAGAREQPRHDLRFGGPGPDRGRRDGSVGSSRARAACYAGSVEQFQESRAARPRSAFLLQGWVRRRAGARRLAASWWPPGSPPRGRQGRLPRPKSAGQRGTRCAGKGRQAMPDTPALTQADRR
jgi:hypothetical protein